MAERVSHSIPTFSVAFSPRVMRWRVNNNQNKSQGKRGQIFDNDPVLRELRDKTMREINAKFADRNKKAADERKKAAEIRQKQLEAKNKLAKENEQRRKKDEEEKKARSERALAKLIESRKRRR